MIRPVCACRCSSTPSICYTCRRTNKFLPELEFGQLIYSEVLACEGRNFLFLARPRPATGRISPPEPSKKSLSSPTRPVPPRRPDAASHTGKTYTPLPTVDACRERCMYCSSSLLSLYRSGRFVMPCTPYPPAVSRPMPRRPPTTRCCPHATRLARRSGVGCNCRETASRCFGKTA